MNKALIALVLLLTVCLVSASAGETEILGQPFPDFTVTDTQGNTFTLSEVLKDHEAALINIWATWCPYSRAQLPFLNEAFGAYGDRVAFLALSGEAEDTIEMIEAYHQENHVAFPMGRDEGQTLFRYLGRQGYPTVVIVDKFGNAAFLRVGNFFSAGEIKRTIEYFLGDSYTESAVLTDVPRDTSTRAMQVSAATGVHVENENVRNAVIHVEGEANPTRAYVIHDDIAHLRLTAASADDPFSMICYDFGLVAFHELAALTVRDGYLYDTTMPDSDARSHYSYIGLLSSVTGEEYAGAYLVSDEAYMEELIADMTSWGYGVTWEYEDSLPAGEAAPQTYILHITDQDGAPVPGVMVKLCTDTACVLLQADENGVVSYDGAPDACHVQLLKVPDGYSFDAEFEMTTDAAYGAWVLRIWKN